MKKTALFAFAGAILLTGRAFADMDGVAQTYVPGAFDNADSSWRRITANSVVECGAYGGNGQRRIDVLIDRYEALGDALEGGDAGAIGEAAEGLKNAMTANGRFEKCWDKIARKNGISRDFKRSIESL